MTDILLTEAMKKERWQTAIEKAKIKDIDHSLLKSLCTPETRINIYNRIKNNNYSVMPPHEAQIPKDNGEFRIVYANEGIDRVILSIFNDIIFEKCKDMIHPSCVSYQKGIGCGKVVQNVTRHIKNCQNNCIGIKADLSKYFDSVKIEYIDKCFDEIEGRVGKSKIIDVLREYYHMNFVFDLKNNLIEKYTSLRQGCAVAAFLADAVLYDIDQRLSSMEGIYYVRYSDDILVIGENWQEAYKILAEMLKEKGLILNPKKVEELYKDKWFKFLGFNIKGEMITLSKNRVKTFQKEIEKRTTKTKSHSLHYLLNNVNNYLYKGAGDEGYCWATNVLPIINVQKDINTLNEFVLDAIRGSVRKRTRIGGLGSVNNLSDKTIIRGKGRNVKKNRENTEATIEGYYSLSCMQNALLTSRDLYNTLVAQL